MTIWRPGIIVLALAAFLFFPPCLSAQDNASPPKFALVIGNGGYDEPNSLRNPVNDAFDTGLALRDMGFVVDLVLNGSLEEIENSLTRFKDRLGATGKSYGFFFFAGHAVQSGGDNYLIPVSVQITKESDLITRAVSVQAILDDLNGAGNSLNVVVLDACRDNTFGWDGEQGLAVPGRQYENSIIIYSASEGQTVADGEGRNSVFTIQLLKNLKNTRREVNALFNRIIADVSRESGKQQIPAMYNHFSGKAYLGTVPGKAVDTTRLWSVGGSVGLSFATPQFIGTVHGTFAPLKYTFLEVGFDLGLGTKAADAEHLSLYPFLHYAYFMPFARSSGWYAGAGGSYMFAQYTFPEGSIWENTWAVDFCTGFIFRNIFTLSYTARTNFKSAHHKLAVGAVWRYR
jgi:hypothetical protein